MGYGAAKYFAVSFVKLCGGCVQVEIILGIIGARKLFLADGNYIFSRFGNCFGLHGFVRDSIICSLTAAERNH